VQSKDARLDIGAQWLRHKWCLSNKFRADWQLLYGVS